MITVITPIGPTHTALFEACRQSVQAQTFPCQHLYEIDLHRDGPAAIRNRLLSQVTTPYVIFLDADDTIDPRFAELTLAAMQAGHYVYTDWYQFDPHSGQRDLMPAPDQAWVNGTWHCVTTLLLTEHVRMIGGFDESLAGIEDTDFYLKLTTRGACGIRLPLPLFTYRRFGGRAESIHSSGNVLQLKAEMHQRYGGYMSCCGVEASLSTEPLNTKEEGDVLVMALWKGNRQERGRASGRWYPRTSFPHRLYVNEHDAKAAPQLWQRVIEAEPLPEVIVPEIKPDGLEAFLGGLVKQGVYLPAPTTLEPLTVPRRPGLPNVRQVLRLAKVTDYPIFVAPRRDYPSYHDLYSLIRLSGYELSHNDQIDLSDSTKTYVFVSPESVPDVSKAKARCIFWQFEYQGDYTRQGNLETFKEVWSSDPEHAKLTKARYVLLGSHPDLNPDPGPQEKFYDALMLAYMTGRRQAIKEQLSDLAWPRDYPGHDGPERHEVLKQSRLMVHVFQHDRPALAPIRYALAAAYRLPVLVEKGAQVGPYKDVLRVAPYDGLPNAARDLLNQSWQDGTYADQGDTLYSFLCQENRFDKIVERELGR